MSSNKMMIFVCILFISCGIYMWVRGFPSIKTGELIHGLSPTHAYNGYEAVAGGAVCILGGVAGIWAVLRRKS